MVSIPQVAKFWADSAQVPAPTSGGGNQSFTFVGTEPGDGSVSDGLTRRGSPKLALFFGTIATANDTATDDAVLFFGACQLDEGGSEKQQVHCTFAEHNVSTSNTGHRGASDACCMIIDSAGAVVGEASFSSISQNGTSGNITVVVNWSNLPSMAARITCVVLGGTALSVDMATHDNSGSRTNGNTEVHTLSNLDVEPTALIFQSIGQALMYQDTANARGEMALGFASYNGTAIEQAGQSYQQADNVSTGANRTWQGWANRVIRGLTQTIGGLATVQGSIQVTDMATGTAGEYETTTRDYPSSPGPLITWGVIGIAIDSDEVDVHVTEPQATNAGTGTQTWDVGHTPILNLYLMSLMNTNSNVHFAANAAGAVGIGVITSSSKKFCASIANQRNASTSNTQSRIDGKPVNLNTHSGGTGHQADFDSVTPGTGFVVDWTNHNGAGADAFKILSFQRAPTVIAMDVADAALQVVGASPDVVTPVEPVRETLQLVQTAPDVVIPVIAPLSALQLQQFVPGVATPVSMAVQILTVGGAVPGVVIPVIPPLSILQLVSTAPAIPVIVTTPASILQLIAAAPDVVLPIGVAAQILQLVSTVPGVPVIVTAPASILQIVQALPTVITPVSVAVQALQIVTAAVDVVLPVDAPVSILQLAQNPTGVSTPVTVAAQILQLVAAAPDVLSPVVAPLSALQLLATAPELLTPVEAPHSVLQLVQLTPGVVTPLGAPLSILQLVATAPRLPVTIPLATQVLQVLATAPGIVTPPAPPLSILQLQQTVPSVPTIITSPLSSLQLVPGAHTVDDGVGAEVVIVVPAVQLLQLASTVPSAILSGSGCYVWLHNVLRTRFRSLVQAPRALSTVYDNDPDDVPENDIWARFHVEHDDVKLLQSGGDGRHTYRKTGKARVSLYVAALSGTSALLAAADAIDLAFRFQRDLVVYGTPSMFSIGRVGRWYSIDVVCPWYFDEVHPVQATGSGFALPDFAALHNAIRTRFGTEVETPESITVIYDNDTEVPPEVAVAGVVWVRFTILSGESFFAEHGGTAGQHRYRTPGVAKAEIFGRLLEGDGVQLALADVIVPAFRGLSDSGVTYKTPRVKNIGRDGMWWKVNVTIPFYADDIG